MAARVGTSCSAFVPVSRVMRKQSALKELTLTPLVQQHLISQELKLWGTFYSLLFRRRLTIIHCLVWP
ncbi:hypothetical protein CapIbe_000416 [Capra ibex]